MHKDQTSAPCAACCAEIPIEETQCPECGEDPAAEEVECRGCEGVGSRHYIDWSRVRGNTISPPEVWRRCHECDGERRVPARYFEERQQALHREVAA